MTTISAHVVQPTVPMFHAEVAVRQKDGARFAERESAFAIIGDPLEELPLSGLPISVDSLFEWAICAKLAEIDGRRTKKELAKQVPALRRHALHDLIITDGSLRFVTAPGPGITEYVGVGAGLSVIEALLTLDPSYFRRIPMTSCSKTLDFEGCYRASTGDAYVQIETRGRQDGEPRNR